MRISKDHYFIKMAKLASERSTCLRRSVGCILTNEEGHVLATGYNGVPKGYLHCNERSRGGFPFACEGVDYPSGQGLDLCQAVHAEQNALLQCGDVSKIHSVYCTAAPCITCIKLLLNTGARRIIYLEDYPHIQKVKALWDKDGRIIFQFKE